MNDLMDFLTSTEIIVVYLVVAVVCFIGLIVYLFDRNSEKRKQKQNTRELNKLVEKVNEKMGIEVEEEVNEVPVLEKIEEVKEEISAPVVKEEIETPVQVTPVVEPIIVETVDSSLDDNEVVSNQVGETEGVENLVLDSMPEEELEYTDIEPNMNDAQAELQRLTETLEQAEQASKNIDLTSFEVEQEENAIISLDELMSRGRVMYENDLFSKFEDEGNEPISLADLEAQFNKKSNEEIKPEENAVVQEQMILDDFNTVSVGSVSSNLENHGFKSSPVISPVYGIEKNSIASVNEMELENTANYEKLDEEIKKTNEFLVTLRELQKNLD